jgi:hypothetical protein
MLVFGAGLLAGLKLKIPASSGELRDSQKNNIKNGAGFKVTSTGMSFSLAILVDHSVYLS